MSNHDAGEHDAEFMSIALDLARRGQGAVEPNPMVGAVLVRDGSVLGQGYHRAFGGPHAEIEAIAAARQAGHDLAGATLYVSLEPCCHQGKTPPCTDMVIAAGIARVVAAMQDPDEKVAGQGFAALRQAGIAVAVGVLGQRARASLAAYIKLRTRHRPWVICKWAQSLDGKIATYQRNSKWITGAPARERAHQLRGLCDGVCVGIGTVWDDDPLLTNRSGVGRQPARLILDGRLEIPPTCRLLESLDVAPLVVVTRMDSSPIVAEQLVKAGAEVLRLSGDESGIDLEALLDELGRRQWTRLLVEGGRGVLSSFLKRQLADELVVFVAPCLIGGRYSVGPVDWEDVNTIEQSYPLPSPSVEQVGRDLMLRYLFSAG